MDKKKLQLAFVILSLSFVLGACGGGNGEGRATAAATVEPTGNEREIIIQGSNFAFDQEEYIVAVGEAVKVVYKNAEGNHGISVKKTNISLQHNQETVVQFNEPGSYDIICNIYCGAGHANMMAKIVVE